MAISFPQNKQTTSPTTGTTIVAAFPSGIAAGSIIAVAGYFDPAATTVTVTNDQGDAITDSGLGLIVVSGIAGVRTYVKAFLSPTTGAKTVTATFNATIGFADIGIWEIAGLTGAVFDKVVQATGATTSTSSGSTGTLSASSEAAIGWGASNNTFTVQGSGWALDAIDGNGAIHEHQVLSSNASIAATATQSGNDAYILWCATFMSGAAPAATPYNPWPLLGPILAQRARLGWLPWMKDRGKLIWRPSLGIPVRPALAFRPRPRLAL